MSPLFKAVRCVAGAAFVVLGAAGCASNEPQTPPTVVNTTPPPAAPVVTTTPVATTPGTPGVAPATKVNVNAGPGTSQGTDQATGEAVNKAIVTNKQMTGSRVEAVVTAGVATLTGSVQNAQQKALAEKAARDTPGVSSVKNKIQINPTGGAKSATKPPVTKVIVVHEQAPPPKTSPAPPSPPAAPATDNSGGANGNASGTNSTDTGSSTDSTSSPNAPKTNDSAQ